MLLYLRVSDVNEQVDCLSLAEICPVKLAHEVSDLHDRMQFMEQMTPAAVERAMKLQDVMLRAMAKRITWYQAAEIPGISCRQMLRWQTRFKHEGYE